MSTTSGDATRLAEQPGVLTGVLTDQDIITLCTNDDKRLITENFEPDNVHQTCYHLRVGRVAYYLSRNERDRRFKISDQAGAQAVVIRPSEVVTIVSLEKFEMPADIVGRIISKGYLFAIGLSPVITFVDPGFKGHLGITLVNLSKNTVELEYKEQFCKIEFEKLPKPVRVPFSNTSHHDAEEDWFFKTNKFKERRKAREIDAGELKRTFEEDITFFGEPFDLIGAIFENVDQRFIRYQTRLKYTIIGVLSVGIAFVSYLGVQFYSSQDSSMKGAILRGLIPAIFGVITSVSLFVIDRARKS